MKEFKEKEANLNHLKNCLKNNQLTGLEGFCDWAFGLKSGKQILNWLRYNEPEIDNKIEALKAVNGIGLEDLEEDSDFVKDVKELGGIEIHLSDVGENEIKAVNPNAKQSKTDQVNDMVTVFMNHTDFNFEHLIDDELVFNGISLTILDFRMATIPSIELVIRDANTEQSEIYNIGTTNEEALERFQTEVKDLLFDAFMCFSVC